jgi:uncharacterized protein YfiM (DUF2279 family)
MIEHDRAHFVRMWMLQALGAQGPTTIEMWQSERFAIRQTVYVGALQRWLSSQLQGHVNHRLNILRR